MVGWLVSCCCCYLSFFLGGGWGGGEEVAFMLMFICRGVFSVVLSSDLIFLLTRSLATAMGNLRLCQTTETYSLHVVVTDDRAVLPLAADGFSQSIKIFLKLKKHEFVSYQIHYLTVPSHLVAELSYGHVMLHLP